jgi:hypothetical protein
VRASAAPTRRHAIRHRQVAANSFNTITRARLKAKLCRTDSDSRSALDWAKSKKHAEIAKVNHGFASMNCVVLVYLHVSRHAHDRSFCKQLRRIRYRQATPHVQLEHCKEALQSQVRLKKLLNPAQRNSWSSKPNLIKDGNSSIRNPTVSISRWLH